MEEKKDGVGDGKKLDEEKIVEYPGFNSPLLKGFQDVRSDQEWLVIGPRKILRPAQILRS